MLNQAELAGFTLQYKETKAHLPKGLSAVIFGKVQLAFPRTKLSPAQKAGLAYQKKAFARLKQEYGHRVSLNPWIEYHDLEGRHYCQPDAVVFFPTYIMLFEVKVRHSKLAYEQLKLQYAPLLEWLYPDHRIVKVEMTKSYDGAIQFPEKVEVFFDNWGKLNTWAYNAGKEIGVLQWKP